MTFDDNADYIEENFDPSDYKSFEDMLIAIYQDYDQFSSNPDVLNRKDIQEFIEDLYYEQILFDVEELESIEEFLPETEQELSERFQLEEFANE